MSAAVSPPRRRRPPARRARPLAERLEGRALLTITIDPQVIADSPNSWPPVSAGTFTDSDASLKDTDFVVTFAWSDGTTSTGSIDSVAGEPGTFAVQAQKSFPGPGTYTATETIATRDGTDSATAQTSAKVSINPVLDVFDILPAMANEPVPVQAIYPDPGLPGLTASIDWGDGTTTDGVITSDPGDPIWTYTALTVASGGSGHAYATPGRYTITVDLLGADGAVIASGRQGVTITADQPATFGAGIRVGVDQDVDLSGWIAAFSDWGGSSDPADYTATIDWGDGTTSDGMIGTNPSPGGDDTGMPFIVNGSHTYSAVGTYPITVTVTPKVGGPFSATSQAFITTTPFGTMYPVIAIGNPSQIRSLASSQPAPTGVIVPSASVQTTVGAMAAPTFGTFTGAAGAYMLAIDWGDGSAPSFGQVVAGATSGGETTYTLSGMHAYRMAGDYTVTLHLIGPGGVSAWGATEAVVSSGSPSSAYQLGGFDPAFGMSAWARFDPFLFSVPSTTGLGTASTTTGATPQTSATTAGAEGWAAWLAIHHPYAYRKLFGAAASGA